MTLGQKIKLQLIIDTYGTAAQTDIAIEECSELIKALVKGRRNAKKGIDKELKEAIIDEIADVEIMMNQLIIIHSCRKEVEERIDFKIDRQIERLKNYE